MREQVDHGNLSLAVSAESSGANYLPSTHTHHLTHGTIKVNQEDNFITLLTYCKNNCVLWCTSSCVVGPLKVKSWKQCPLSGKVEN